MWRAAVLGLGKIGLMYDFEPGRQTPSSHVMAYHLDSDYELVMGADPVRQREADLLKVAPEAAYYPCAADGLYQTQPDIISICTPPSLHLRQIRQVFEQVQRPRLIFCEKPLANNLDEAYALRDLCAEYPKTIVVPNITRRWSTGMKRITEAWQSGDYGQLQKIHIRYTRGICNTGAHLFDLLRMWTGASIETVRVLQKVPTSSESEQEPSYSFFFRHRDSVYGYAEAMDDRQYYLFEIDMYGSRGKIEMRYSGDEVRYYQTTAHHLFSGFQELNLVNEERQILSEPILGKAFHNLARVLEDIEQPACLLKDALYPLQVAEALKRSYVSGHEEQVKIDE